MLRQCAHPGCSALIGPHPLDAVQPEALTGAELERVRALSATPRGVRFYQSPQWRRMRREVMQEHNGECLACKARGGYARAEMVHHVWYLGTHPELALARRYWSGGQAYLQLVPLCHSCHEDAHMHRHADARPPLTPERW